jgi:hypothetical protein
MLFELLSGLRLAHACTFYDGGGGGDGGGTGTGADAASDAPGLGRTGAEGIGIDVGAGDPGGLGRTGAEGIGIDVGSTGITGIGSDISATGLFASSDPPGLGRTGAKGVGLDVGQAFGDASYQSAAPGKGIVQGEGVKPVVPGKPVEPEALGQKDKAKKEERRLTREQKRRKRSILGSDEQWAIHAPGRRKTLFGE